MKKWSFMRDEQDAAEPGKRFKHAETINILGTTLALGSQASIIPNTVPNGTNAYPSFAETTDFVRTTLALASPASITPSFEPKAVANGKNASPPATAAGGRARDYSASPTPGKFTAAKFPATLLRIGTWEFKPSHARALSIKCYYNRRKLIWELLDGVGVLKKKIEIDWSRILAIRANEGILEIELDSPPMFYKETNPQPRNPNWQATLDFTYGQASVCRRHCLQCSPKELDRYFRKLLKADSRLLQLSKQPFPSLDCPYFDCQHPFSLGPGININNAILSPAPLPPFQQFPTIYQRQQPSHGFNTAHSHTSALNGHLTMEGNSSSTSNSFMMPWWDHERQRLNNGNHLFGQPASLDPNGGKGF